MGCTMASRLSVCDIKNMTVMIMGLDAAGLGMPSEALLDRSQPHRSHETPSAAVDWPHRHLSIAALPALVLVISERAETMRLSAPDRARYMEMDSIAEYVSLRF